MSLRYRLFGLPCAFCDRPVDHIVIYVNAVVTVHAALFQPPCVFVRCLPPVSPTGGVVDAIPRAPAPSVGSSRWVA